MVLWHLFASRRQRFLVCSSWCVSGHCGFVSVCAGGLYIVLGNESQLVAIKKKLGAYEGKTILFFFLFDVTFP